MTGSQPRNPRKEMIGNSIAERVEELACLGRPPTATSGGGLTLADSSTSGQNASMPRSWGMSPCETFACPHCGAVYAVRYTQLPVRDSDSVYCEICHQKMMQWHSTARPSYTLIERPRSDDK